MNIEKVVVGWAWKVGSRGRGWGKYARDTGRVFVQLKEMCASMEGTHKF